MSAPRPLLPTDLVALVSYEGEVYPNQAMPWERLGRPGAGHPLETALEQWFSFASGRHTWISLRGQTVRGLLSARQRAHRSVWEVDCLIAEELGVCRELLERLGSEAARAGVERLFLRLSADSGLLPAAQEAAFSPYLEEELWARPGPQPPAPTAGGEGQTLALRRRTQADLLALFQLYNALAPASVRWIEGLTLTQWWGAREGGRGRSRPQELVLEEGSIVAWLRLATEAELGRFSLLVHPAARGALTPLMKGVVARLAPRRLVVALVPGYMAWAGGAMAQEGFAPAGRYTLLARPVAQPVPAPERAPAGYYALPAS